MCFNISISNNKNAIEKQLNAKFENENVFEPQKHISAFSNPLIPVITSEDNRKIQLCHWGLIPEWVQNKKKANEIRKMTYNARCETIKEKRSFRDSIKDKKCHCTHNCAMVTSILYNEKKWPNLIYQKKPQ